MSQKFLYHYSSAEKALLILQEMKLKVSKYQYANDMNEIGHFISSIDCFKDIDLYNFIREECGFISFSKDDALVGYSIPTMWAYYADNNKGVCIKINERKFTEINSEYIKKIPICDVHYEKYVNKAKEYDINGLSNDEIIIKYYKDFFLRKQQAWSHEQERRLCIIHNPDSLSLEGCIEGVYFGNKMPNEIKMRIAEIMGKRLENHQYSLVRTRFYNTSIVDGRIVYGYQPFGNIDLDAIHSFFFN